MEKEFHGVIFGKKKMFNTKEGTNNENFLVRDTGTVSGCMSLVFREAGKQRRKLYAKTEGDIAPFVEVCNLLLLIGFRLKSKPE